MADGPPVVETILPIPMSSVQDIEGWLSNRNCELRNALEFKDSATRVELWWQWSSIGKSCARNAACRRSKPHVAIMAQAISVRTLCCLARRVHFFVVLFRGKTSQHASQGIDGRRSSYEVVWPGLENTTLRRSQHGLLAFALFTAPEFALSPIHAHLPMWPRIWQPRCAERLGHVSKTSET